MHLPLIMSCDSGSWWCWGPQQMHGGMKFTVKPLPQGSHLLRHKCLQPLGCCQRVGWL